MIRPVVRVTSANIKFAEVSGSVTVGEETAALLSKKLGRKVEAGEIFDLGTLAVYHRNPIKRFFASLNIKKHILN